MKGSERAEGDTGTSVVEVQTKVPYPQNVPALEGKCPRCGLPVVETGCPRCGYGARFRVAAARSMHVPECLLIGVSLVLGPFGYALACIVFAMNWRRFGRLENARAAALLLFADAVATMASTQFVFHWPHMPGIGVPIISCLLSALAAYREVLMQRPLWVAWENGRQGACMHSAARSWPQRGLVMVWNRVVVRLDSYLCQRCLS